MGQLEVLPGTATAVGSLPHLDPRRAAELVLEVLPGLPAAPSLPRRSPAEGILAQALVGVRGVGSGPDGELTIDPHRLDPLAPVHVDLGHEAFGGLRAFLAAARGRTGPVKWQVCGPITLGRALTHHGVPAPVAFDVAVRAVREHVAVVVQAVGEALPACQQVVVLDEPGFGRTAEPGFPLDPEAAIDLLSGALAAAEPGAVTGVHCCGEGDWEAILAAGPSLLSVPVTVDLTWAAPAVAGFLDAGGTIAWGCVPTDRPVGELAERPWRDMVQAWCELVRRGVDPVRLSRQSLLSPACGLGAHGESQAESVLGLVAALAERMRQESAAPRLIVGA